MKLLRSRKSLLLNLQVESQFQLDLDVWKYFSGKRIGLETELNPGMKRGKNIQAKGGKKYTRNPASMRHDHKETDSAWPFIRPNVKNLYLLVLQKHLICNTLPVASPFFVYKWLCFLKGSHVASNRLEFFCKSLQKVANGIDPSQIKTLFKILNAWP